MGPKEQPARLGIDTPVGEETEEEEDDVGPIC